MWLKGAWEGEIERMDMEQEDSRRQKYSALLRRGWEEERRTRERKLKHPPSLSARYLTCVESTSASTHNRTRGAQRRSHQNTAASEVEVQDSPREKVASALWCMQSSCTVGCDTRGLSPV